LSSSDVAFSGETTPNPLLEFGCSSLLLVGKNFWFQRLETNKVNKAAVTSEKNRLVNGHRESATLRSCRKLYKVARKHK
jgi:hypothetical protein